MDTEIKNKLMDTYESIKNYSEKEFVKYLTENMDELEIPLRSMNKIREYVSLRSVNENGELI